MTGNRSIVPASSNKQTFGQLLCSTRRFFVLFFLIASTSLFFQAHIYYANAISIPATVTALQMRTNPIEGSKVKILYRYDYQFQSYNGQTEVIFPKLPMPQPGDLIHIKIIKNRPEKSIYIKHPFEEIIYITAGSFYQNPIFMFFHWISIIFLILSGFTAYRKDEFNTKEG